VKKIKSSGLDAFFELIVTSETTGFRKPDPRIFHYAKDQHSTNSELCLMIGDNPSSDLLGAQHAKIDQVFFNPEGKVTDLNPTYTITHLRELKDLL
jgi:putative hydrolase of the HAD superfamily